MGLLEGLGVHQDHIGAFGVAVGVVLVVGLQALDGVCGAPALIGLVAGFQVAHFDLDEGAAFAWRDDLLLEHRPAAPVMLDHLAGADQVRLLFHGGRLCRWNGGGLSNRWAGGRQAERQRNAAAPGSTGQDRLNGRKEARQGESIMDPQEVAEVVGHNGHSRV